MKLLQLRTIATLSLLVAAYASAEEYQGVLDFHSNRTRAEVSSEAVTATRAVNPYADGAQAGEPAQFVSQRSRESVRPEAVETAHAPNQNVKTESRVNSIVRQDLAARSWNAESKATQAISSPSSPQPGDRS